MVLSYHLIFVSTFRGYSIVHFERVSSRFALSIKWFFFSLLNSPSPRTRSLSRAIVAKWFSFAHLHFILAVSRSHPFARLWSLITLIHWAPCVPEYSFSPSSSLHGISVRWTEKMRRNAKFCLAKSRIFVIGGLKNAGRFALAARDINWRLATGSSAEFPSFGLFSSPFFLWHKNIHARNTKWKGTCTSVIYLNSVCSYCPARTRLLSRVRGDATVFL